MDDLLKKLFSYLTKSVGEENDLFIFRTHNNKLDTSGDISFPLNINAWKKHVASSTNDNITILQYNPSDSEDIKLQNLISESRKWDIAIVKYDVVINNKVNLYLHRTKTIKYVIQQVLLARENYGLPSQIAANSRLEIRVENSGITLSEMDLTQLRIKLLKDVTENFLKFTESDWKGNGESEIVYLTNKSENCLGKKIICGVVISNKFGKKNTNISAEEYYSRRTMDMRLMAQHKYGMRVHNETGWQNFFEQLGTAAVTFDLLHVKPSRTIVINVDNATSPHSKGASFILYNCARLASILKQFEQKVSLGIYPALPSLDDVDFSLLNQPEEWEILCVYILQYPGVVRSCVRDIFDYKLNVHNLCTFLDSLCSVFSIYYRRIRILMEPRVHLFPVLHARLYLLQAVQEVLHSALGLLNIPPVKQM